MPTSAMEDRDHEHDLRVLRPPARARLSARQRRCGRTCCRAWRCHAAPQALAVCRRCSRRRCARCGWRSASAAASTGLAGQAQSRRRAHRLRAVRGRRRQGAERHRARWSGQHQGLRRRRAAAAAAAAGGQHRPGVRPVSRPLAEEAPPQAPAGLRCDLAELARILRPGGELRIATESRRTHAQFCCAVARARAACAGPRAGPQDWRQRPPDWPQTRYEAKALQGGPALLLFPLYTDLRQPVLRCSTRCDNFYTSCLPNAQFPPSIRALMIISTLRVGPWGPLFLFWGEPLSIPKRMWQLYS